VQEAAVALLAMTWFNNFVKSAGAFPISWVDFLTIIVLLVGVVRGRKRGLSEEILDTVQWLLILFACAFLYKGFALVLNYKPIFSQLTYYIISYLLIAAGIKIIFLLIKRRFGQKIVESDVFGRIEFYGGMAAGAVRFACVYLFVLSLLHAPHYSPEYWAQRAKDVDYNYGSDFFPHPCKIQKSVFENSITGIQAKKHLEILLIEQTSGNNAKAIRNESSLAKRNERAIDAIMGGR
jgi:uncharacterized membrane protein required for colicin V production